MLEDYLVSSAQFVVDLLEIDGDIVAAKKMPEVGTVIYTFPSGTKYSNGTAFPDIYYVVDQAKQVFQVRPGTTLYVGKLRDLMTIEELLTSKHALLRRIGNAYKEELVAEDSEY